MIHHVQERFSVEIHDDLVSGICLTDHSSIVREKENLVWLPCRKIVGEILSTLQSSNFPTLLKNLCTSTARIDIKLYVEI